MNKDLLNFLQCPLSGGELTLSDDGQFLLSKRGQCRYPFVNDIAMLLVEHAQPLTDSVEQTSALSSANPSLHSTD